MQGDVVQGAHYPNVNRLEDDVEMLAACELDAEKLAQVAQKYEFPHTFTDHRKMLDAQDLDIVYCVMNERVDFTTRIGTV